MDELQKTGWDDRLAAAGVAIFIGFPTAFIAWLVALLIGAEFFHSVPSFRWALGAWALLVLAAFVIPYRIDAIFGRIWKWLLHAIAAIAQTIPS